MSSLVYQRHIPTTRFDCRLQRKTTRPPRRRRSKVQCFFCTLDAPSGGFNTGRFRQSVRNSCGRRLFYIVLNTHKHPNNKDMSYIIIATLGARVHHSRINTFLHTYEQTSQRAYGVWVRKFDLRFGFSIFFHCAFNVRKSYK